MQENIIAMQARLHGAVLIRKRQLPAQFLFMMLIGAALFLMASDASAASAMPWEEPLCAVANSMKSTVARAAAVIAIVIAGLAMAFGELNGIFKTLMGLIAGASMALLSTSWLGFLGGGSVICAGVA